jgi:CRP-like cAMP-binding protein
MQELDPIDRTKTVTGLSSDKTPGGAGSGLLFANALFRAMEPDAVASLLATGRRVVFRAGQTLWLPGLAADTICFPLSGVVAGLASDLDGGAAQVQCTGPEGAVGLVEGLAGVPLVFEHRAMVDTDAWLAPAETVRALVRARPQTAEILLRHVAHLYDEARRAGACAARHPLRARLADCLLAYQEKTALARLPLTQEMLSTLLGANRTTVTALAIGLSDAGLTRTGRGWISVVDAERLDRIACGCRNSAPAATIRNAPPKLA